MTPEQRDAMQRAFNVIAEGDDADQNRDLLRDLKGILLPEATGRTREYLESFNFEDR